jgi:RluA family pseudouridine synthase
MNDAVIKLSSPATQEFWEIPVLFEDAHLLVLDKPSGLLSAPDRFDPERPHLLQLLHAGITQAKPWAVQRGLSYLAAAQRLDFETSGVLLLSKSKTVLVALANFFGNEKPALQFVALTEGPPPESPFDITAKIGPDTVKTGLMRIDSRRGKRARTLFTVAERFDGWTLLRCQPLTHRTHQVRVHLRHARLPVVGDRLYGGHELLLSRLKRGYRLKGDQPERPLIAAPALHAEALSLPHPVTAEPLHIAAPWPKDLTVAVKYLRRYAPASP